jgi:hypothetical protein
VSSATVAQPTAATSEVAILGLMRVLQAGPIAHADIERYDDPDIETGLEHCGHDTTKTSYRLIELEIGELEDAARFPFDWEPTTILEALARGENVPPIVVIATDRGRGYGLVDGLNRTYAHWLSGRPTIRAYEVLVGSHS